jgi:hypothetical protein
MGYLNVDESTLPNFTKAIISLWFRVPRFSVAAANAAVDNVSKYPAPLNGVIPLVVMGENGSYQPNDTIFKPVVHSEQIDLVSLVGTDNGVSTTVDTPIPGNPYGAFHYVETIVYNANAHVIPADPPSESFSANEAFTVASGPTVPLDPTCIGLSVAAQDLTLYVNFQTNMLGKVTNAAFETHVTQPSITQGDGFDIPVGTVVWQGDVFPVDVINVVQTENTVTTVHLAGTGDGSSQPAISTATDISDILYTTTANITSDEIVVLPDVWNHLLVSVDLQTIATHGGSGTEAFASHFDSTSQLYVALNDINYTGYKLSVNFCGDPSNPNGVVSDDAEKIVSDPVQVDGSGNEVIPTYVLSDPEIPCEGQAMGLPATTAFVNDIYDVDHAEFQMWVGQKIDTGDEAMRRLFIDAKRKPVKPSVAAAKLGQPDILLHGTGNWEKGKNTGKIGLNFDGTLKRNGQFTPKGTIIKFRPDPILTGDPVKPKNPKSLG